MLLSSSDTSRTQFRPERTGLNMYATVINFPCISTLFQTMNSVRTKCMSLKVLRFTTSGCKDIVVRKFEFVAKTQFLRVRKNYLYPTNGLYLGKSLSFNPPGVNKYPPSPWFTDNHNNNDNIYIPLYTIHSELHVQSLTMEEV